MLNRPHSTNRTDASGLAGVVSESAAFDCGTSWIIFAIWAVRCTAIFFTLYRLLTLAQPRPFYLQWLGISISLQLSIAFSAIGCSEGARSNSLPKPGLRKRRRTVKASSSASRAISDDTFQRYRVCASSSSDEEGDEGERAARRLA